MTKAKNWIDKRTDGVVAKAFNLSYCIRIGMCKKSGIAAEMHQRDVRAQHGGNNTAQSNGRASTTVFTCMHTCVSCMHVNTFMNRALRIAAGVPRAMPCRNIAPHFVCEAVSYVIAAAAMCSGPCTAHVNVSSPSWSASSSSSSSSSPPSPSPSPPPSRPSSTLVRSEISVIYF